MYPELTVPLVVLTGAALGYVLLVVARQPVQRWLALRQVAIDIWVERWVNHHGVAIGAD